MMSVLDRKLLVTTGKGGTGKTTIAAALGLLASRRGVETIVVEVGDQGRLPGLFGGATPEPGVETHLEERLWSISVDPDRALLEWLQVLGGRVPGRILASSGTFQYFAAAAPGAREMVSMVKIWELTARRDKRARAYDLVILDAPATGNALGMLSSPATFGSIARVGAVAGQAERVVELLRDPASSAFLAVAQGTEMAVSETLELQQAMRSQLGRGLDGVIANAMLPRRFTGVELAQIAELNGGRSAAGSADLAGSADGDVELIRSAAAAARSIHDRARDQHSQVARLRREGFEVLGVPFAFSPKLDVEAIGRIADHLGRGL